MLKPYDALTNRAMKLFPLLLTSFTLLALQAPGQTPDPMTASGPPLRSPEELEQLLAPIALYPDPLIAAILPAATVPLEIVMADRYLMNGGEPNDAEQQGWDSSVVALVWYPTILQWMDNNLPWTSAVGQAFLEQPQDVFDAIQRLRAQAQALGNLPNTPEQSVVYDNGSLELFPTTPEVVYVPDYQPEIVYCQRTWGGAPCVRFGRGWRLGPWLHHDIDWRGRRLMVWHHEHPRPADWWSPRFGQRPSAAAAQATVWQPRHGPGPSASERPGQFSVSGPGALTVIGHSPSARARFAPSPVATRHSWGPPAPARPASSAAAATHSGVSGTAAGTGRR